MKPTNRLRFVERFIPVAVAGPGGYLVEGTPMGRTERVLQQWWQDPYMSEDNDPRLTGGEWIDVELVTEQSEKSDL